MTRRPIALALVLIACSTRARGRPAPPSPLSNHTIRVALPASGVRIGATSDFGWYQAEGADGAYITRGRRSEQWFVEYDDAAKRVRAIRPDGQATTWQRGLRVRVGDEGFLTIDGRRYRGELAFVPQDTGVVLVNRLNIEDYLRGVVPVEMGNRNRADSAALQAQAVASRSYA
ncbi:MAG TPA: SpoIID/LytB domain-containing protein, partial [Gemmatimonadaceae bacterium]|nr:SpoIID/LytB domain-containing protein [Gemmatimonadaceae bacterium]